MQECSRLCWTSHSCAPGFYKIKQGIPGEGYESLPQNSFKAKEKDTYLRKWKYSQ